MLSGEKIVKNIDRAIRKYYSSEDKTRVVLDKLRCEDSIAELRRREGHLSRYLYKWFKDFMDAGKGRLSGSAAQIREGRH